MKTTLEGSSLRGHSQIILLITFVETFQNGQNSDFFKMIYLKFARSFPENSKNKTSFQSKASREGNRKHFKIFLLWMFSVNKIRKEILAKSFKIGMFGPSPGP